MLPPSWHHWILAIALSQILIDGRAGGNAKSQKLPPHVLRQALQQP